eukprot:TRINITY_DN20892_c0_g1_i3.p1 TRINITY_DN20892_c0_g1~~TRINITY_DN20892_c0_g1_i3.p1  ORF type:complete len:287 (-),score=54.33 TRINITY_DN20892_c0_g1_i3:267-1127(-)
MVLDAPLIKVALPVRPDDVDSEEGESSSPGFGGSAASCRPGAEGPADSFAALKLSFSGLLEARGEEGDRDSPSAGKPSRDDGLIAQSIGGWDEGDDAVLAATAEPCSASALGKRATRAAAEKQAAPWRQGGAADLLAVVAEIRAATASLSVAAKGRQLRSGDTGRRSPGFGGEEEDEQQQPLAVEDLDELTMSASSRCSSPSRQGERSGGVFSGLRLELQQLSGGYSDLDTLGSPRTLSPSPDRRSRRQTAPSEEDLSMVWTGSSSSSRSAVSAQWTFPVMLAWLF